MPWTETNFKWYALDWEFFSNLNQNLSIIGIIWEYYKQFRIFLMSQALFRSELSVFSIYVCVIFVSRNCQRCTLISESLLFLFERTFDSFSYLLHNLCTVDIIKYNKIKYMHVLMVCNKTNSTRIFYHYNFDVISVLFFLYWTNGRLSRFNSFFFSNLVDMSIQFGRLLSAASTFIF